MTQDISENGKSTFIDNDPLAFLDRQPTEEELMAMGEDANHMLSSPVFNLAWRSTMEHLKSELFASEPHEKQKREQIYDEMRFANRVLWKLRGFIGVAQQISEERARNEEIAQADARARFRTTQQPMM